VQSGKAGSDGEIPPPQALYLEQRLADKCGQVNKFCYFGLCSILFRIRAIKDEAWIPWGFPIWSEMESSVDSTAVGVRIHRPSSVMLCDTFMKSWGVRMNKMCPVPDLFCHTVACCRGLGTPRIPSGIPPELGSICLLWQSNLFLAAYNGARFHQLLDGCKVSNSSKIVTVLAHSWPTLQHYADPAWSLPRSHR
jgi:hypothetical protein